METKDAKYFVFVKMYDKSGIRKHNWMSSFSEYFDYENFINLSYHQFRKTYPDYRVEFEAHGKIITSIPYSEEISQ